MTERKIQQSRDERALRILDLLGEANRDAVPAREARADLVHALGQIVDTGDGPAPSDAEAARIALQLLAAEPRFAGPIKAMRSGPQTRALGPGLAEGTFLIVGLLLALQTQFEFERDKDGRWSIKVRKKPTSDALLKPLVKKLSTLLGLGG